MTKLDQGDRMPPVTLLDSDGASVSLRGFEGAPYVLYVYPANGTTSCNAEANAFSTLAGAFAELGMRVIGISPDTPSSHRKFGESHARGVTLLSDENHAAIEALGVWALKTTFGRTYMGVVRTTFLVDADGRIAEVWRKVRVPGHAEKVLEAAKSLVGTARS